jgi:hypothetical protein
MLHLIKAYWVFSLGYYNPSANLQFWTLVSSNVVMPGLRLQLRYEAAYLNSALILIPTYTLWLPEPKKFPQENTLTMKFCSRFLINTFILMNRQVRELTLFWNFLICYWQYDDCLVCLVPFAICFAYVFMYNCWFCKLVGYFVCM